MKHMGPGRGSSWPDPSQWHFGWLFVVTSIIVIVLFILWSPHEPVPNRRYLLLGGVLIVTLAASDIQTISMQSYRDHMIEHIVVILIIAPVLARGLSVRWSVTKSTIGFVAFVALVPAFHLTRLGGLVMQSHFGHEFELLCFFVVGTIFWLPVYSPQRVLKDSQRVAYVALALPVVATTGLVLWSSSSSSISITGMNMALLTLADIHNGGVVMMVFGTSLMVMHLTFTISDAHFQRLRTRQPLGSRHS